MFNRTTKALSSVFFLLLFISLNGVVFGNALPPNRTFPVNEVFRYPGTQGIGTDVILDINLDRLRYLDDIMPKNVRTMMSNPANVREWIARSDLVVARC